MARRRIKERGTVVDLFCGCGGFSLGAELTGFRSLAAIDIDPILQSAYRRNFPGSRAIQASVADIDASGWRYLLGKARPDGLIGGPPCQGFSPMGRHRKNDPRNTLLGHFYRHVEILRPKFFIMENVPGLLSGDNYEILSNGLKTSRRDIEFWIPSLLMPATTAPPRPDVEFLLSVMIRMKSAS